MLEEFLHGSNFSRKTKIAKSPESTSVAPQNWTFMVSIGQSSAIFTLLNPIYGMHSNQLTVLAGGRELS
jgi:hypothetical protein